MTNEANVGGPPDASDGYCTGAKDALIDGVVAAKAEVRSTGYQQIKVGFSWAYSTARSETAF